MVDEPDATPQRRHLIIAGTGRAGTTFLVRYLTALGLDTHLSRRGENAWLDEEAQAGLEDFPLGPDSANLPYVIKNPMLYEFVDQVVADPSMTIDGVIIPVRDLREATSSRVILERRSMYEHLPWLEYMDKAWETSGNVPGGLIFSLNALDEARTLSVGLHLLVERLVRADIPMVFIDFPRLIDDGDYLYEKLAPLLPAATREAAAAAHAAIADPDKVRTGREMSSSGPEPAASGDLDAQLDRIALLREIARLRKTIARLELSGTTTAVRLQEELALLRQQATQIEGQRAQAAADVFELRDDLKTREAAYHDLQRRFEELQRYFALASEQLEDVANQPSQPSFRPSESEARGRIIASERSTYEFLIGFADDLNSIADTPKTIALIQELRARFADVLDQLELAQSELAVTTAALSRRNRSPGGTLRRGVDPRHAVRRLTSLFRRAASGTRPG